MKKFKLLFIPLIIIICLLIILKAGISQLDKIFIVPVMLTLNEEYKVETKPLYKQAYLDSDYHFISKSVPVIKKESVSKFNLRIAEDTHDFQEGTLNINGEILYINSIFFGSTMLNSESALSIITYFIIFKFCNYIKLNELAQNAFLSMNSNYSWLSPVENMKKFLLRLLYAISIPSYSTYEFSAYSSETFLMCNPLVKNEKMVGVSLLVVNDNEITQTTIISKNKNGNSGNIIRKIIEDLKFSKSS